MYIIAKVMFNIMSKEIQYENKVSSLESCVQTAMLYLYSEVRLIFFYKNLFKGWICHVTYCFFFFLIEC